MKALKIIFGIIVIIALCGGAYMVFFYHPGDVQKIMDNHKKEKEIFESKIAEIEGREKASKDENSLLKKEIVKANERTGKADAARGDWGKKYDESQAEYEKIKETNKPKNEAEFKALNEEQKVIEYGKLKINLDVTESRLIECENGLGKNNALVIEYKVTLDLQASQIKNFENGMALKIERIVEMEFELDRRDATIQALKKVSSKINFKKAAIYTGIVTGIMLAGIKLIQVIFQSDHNRRK